MNLSSAFGACQGDGACVSGLESGRPWFDAATSAAAVSLSVRAAADASNVSAIESWLSGLSWAGTPRVQVVQAPTLTRVVASGPLSASTLGGLPQEAFLSGKEWHTRPLRDEERTDSWLRLDVVGASVGVERCGGPPPCEDGSDLPVPAVLDASGRVLVRVAPRTGGSTALDAFVAAGWSELGSLADASGTVHVVGWADAVALLELGRGHAVPGGLTVTLGVAEDLASLGLGSGPDDLSFLMDGPVAFWGSATLLEMIGAERQCAEDPGCLSYYQGRVAFDPVTGAPQLRLALPAGEDAGIVDAWATRHPDRVRILERWVLADALTFIEWTVSVAGEDDGGVWMELLSDLSTGLSAATDVGITPEPLRAPGLHGDVIGLLDPVVACAGDPACIEPLAEGRAWFDATDMTAALELAVAADPSGADAAAVAQEVAALGWTGGATLRTVDTPLGVRVEALGRLPLSALESLGQEPALSGRPWSTRPQRDEEVTGARLSIAALVTADQVRACLDEPACVPGQDYPLPAVVEPDGRILARLEPASGSAQALLDYATPGWTALGDESTSTDLVVVGWVTWDGVAHFGKGVPVTDDVVPAGLDLLLAHLDDLPGTGDDDVASDDDADPPPDDDWSIGDDDVSYGDDDVTVGDDDTAPPVVDPDPPMVDIANPQGLTSIEGARPGDCGDFFPRHGWMETTAAPEDFPLMANADFYLDPAAVNGDPVLAYADYPSPVAEGPSRSVLQDYYVCRRYREAGPAASVDVPAWCPPTGSEDDWYSLARGSVQDPGVYDDESVSGPFLDGVRITAAEVYFPEPLEVVASLSESTAATPTLPWRTPAQFEVIVRLRAGEFSADVHFTKADASTLDVHVTGGGSPESWVDVPVTFSILRSTAGVALPVLGGADGDPPPLPLALDVSADLDPRSAGPIGVAWWYEGLPPTGDPGVEEQIGSLVYRVVGAALADAIADETANFAEGLQAFLGGYVFALNDAFGCPGRLGPGCDVPIDFPASCTTPGFWTCEDVTLPSIMAVLPTQPAVDSVDGNDLTDCERGGWGSTSGATFVLQLSDEDPIGFPPRSPSTLGAFGTVALSPELLAGGAAVGDVVAAIGDLDDPRHPFHPTDPGDDPDDQVTSLGALLSRVVDSVVRLTVPHDDARYCDRKYADAYGGLGDEVARCVEECAVLSSGSRSLASAGNIDATADLLGGLLGGELTADDAQEVLRGLETVTCNPSCLGVEHDLRDYWARTCRDTVTAQAEPPGDVDDCLAAAWDSDGDGRPDDEEYCSLYLDDQPLDCVPGPFAWKIADAEDGTFRVEVHSAHFEGGDCTLVADVLLDVDGDGIPDGDDPDVVDPDGDGFPNHLDPISRVDPDGDEEVDGEDTIALDGETGIGEYGVDLDPDNQVRFTSVQRVGDTCTRTNVTGVRLYGPEGAADESVPALEDGSEDPAPRLVLWDGTSFGLAAEVPAIVVSDTLVLHGRADVDAAMDLVEIHGELGETCNGTFSDPVFMEADYDFEVTLKGVDVALPVTVEWTLPLAEDRAWQWGQAWREAQFIAPGLSPLLTALLSADSLETTPVMAAVDVAMTPGTPTLTPPPWQYWECQCQGYPGCEVPTPEYCGVDVEGFCGDGIDGDGDGALDCADSDCTGHPACWMDVDYAAPVELLDVFLPPFGEMVDHILLYLLNASMKPGENYAEWDSIASTSPLSDLASTLHSKLDLDGRGHIFAAAVPYFDRVGFWEDLGDSSRGMDGLFPDIDELELLPALLRILPGLSIDTLDVSALGLDRFLGPSVQFMLVDAGVPGGGPSQALAAEMMLDGLNPAGTLAGVREDLFKALWDDVAASLASRMLAPEQSLYAGWQLSPTLVPGASEGAWSGEAYLGFYRLLYPDRELPADAHDLFIWEWRGVELPVVTPGVAGE